jgi:hypothetical protein
MPASSKKLPGGYLACTPVVTACPLSVFTVVEHPPNVARRTIAPNIENKMVRINNFLLVSLSIRNRADG